MVNNDDKGFVTKPNYGMYMVHKEDFDAYITWEGMKAPDLVAFWARYNYGAEVYQFKQWGQWEHISYGIIRRRNPSSGHVEMEDLVVVIDLDAVPPPTPVPWEVVQYAFEQHGREAHLRLMPRTTAGEIYMQEGLRPKDPPHTTIKVILASWQMGFVLVGHATVLLLLAQNRIPIPEINRGTLPDLARQWEHFRNLVGQSASVGDDRKRKGQEPLRVTPIVELDATMLNDLIEQARASDNPIVDNFVAEAWVIREKGAVHMGKSTVPKQGEQFEWLPAWNENAALHLDWLAHPGRVQKCTRLGDHFFLNTKYAPVQDQPWPSWDSVDIPLIPERPYRGKSIDLEEVLPPYAVRSLPPVRSGWFEANFGGAVEDFQLLGEQILHREVELVAAWGSILLFRAPIPAIESWELKKQQDVELAPGKKEGETKEFGVVNVPMGGIEVPKGEVTVPLGTIEMPKGEVKVPGGEVKVPTGLVEVPKGEVEVPKGVVEVPAGDVTKPPEEEIAAGPREDLIVKAFDAGSVIRGFDMGLQCLFDLFLLEGFPGRFFACDPEERIFAEYGFARVREVAAEWATKELKALRGLIEAGVQLRDLENLNIDFLVGDFFGGFRYAVEISNIDKVDDLVDRWEFDEEQKVFVSSFTEEGLNAYKQLVQNFAGKLKYGLHPIQEEYLGFLLKEQSPELYAALARVVKEQEEEAEANGELDPDEPEPDFYDPKPWDEQHDDDAPVPDHPTWEPLNTKGRVKVYRERVTGCIIYDSDEERHHMMLDYLSGGDNENEDRLPQMKYEPLTEEEEKASERRPDEPAWDLPDDDPAWKTVFGDDEEAIRKAREKIRGKKKG